VRRRFRALDLAALAPAVILELAANGVECITDGDIDVGVRVMLVRFPLDTSSVPAPSRRP